jgi:tRNA A37 N6-isopentenylltransferase MiaA
MTDVFAPKIAKIFNCDKCNYSCRKQSELSRHFLTRKHQNTDKILTNTDKNAPKIATSKHVCECGNTYKHRQSLFNHKKHCYNNQATSDYSLKDNTKISSECSITNIPTSPNEIDKELLIKLLLNNQAVMEKMMEIMPTIGNNSHNTTNTNSHNTQNFNIQMFLNDHCKNAMNLTEFIDTLPITAETYDDTIENGLTKTITNMITNGLSQLDILERPIHCTDASRKTLYVKEDNSWEKDNELIRVLVGIRKLAYKQRTMINKWKDVNNGWEKEDNIQTKLTTLVCNSMTDIENDEKETNKIIRAIGKNTYLTSDIKDVYKSALL